MIDASSALIAIGRMIVKPEPGRTGRRTLAALMAGIWFLSSAAATADDTHQAFFAEPTSGRKVTHYLIDLPVKPDQRQTFNIPDDCNEVMRAIDSGVIFHGNIIDRRLWKKTENDCRYDAFLRRHPQRVIADHVSNYDFRNARIPDLPLDPGCGRTDTQLHAGVCNPAATDELGMLRFFPLTSPADEVPDRGDCVPCQLRNGRFRGYVFLEQQGVRCRIDANAPGIRLIAVDFADINGDRILDAVLRFVPIGPASHRTPLVLPLTRLDAAAPFSVPGRAQPPPLD